MSEDEVPAGPPAWPGGESREQWGTTGWASAPPPDGWWPQYYQYEPPPPPRRTPRLRILAVAVVLVAFGASAAGAAAIATRGIHAAGSVSNVDSAIVDIDTTLGENGSAAGTGMLLTSSGEVLTNNHVITRALSITVRLAGSGNQYDAHLVGTDATDDVAVIQLVGASGLPTVPLGDSSTVQVGDQVTALGNALGRGGTPSSATGQVTALDQSITASDETGGDLESLSGMIQMNAAIQPGDSGGPLLNSSNQVIGMDTAASGGRRWQQTGAVEAFAIPINTALTIAHQIVSGSGSPKINTGQGALLGVCAETSTAPPGALIETGCSGAPDGVAPGSPAATTGLAPGDVITGLGGAVVDSEDALRSILLEHHAGDNVILSWETPQGKQQEATITLAAAPPV